MRVGELVSGGVVRHALKINVFGRLNYHFDGREATPGYRWPARSADGYAGDPANACSYGGRVPAMRIGSLVALKPDFPVEALRTEPARILARAFMDYGAYAVDDTCWDVYGLTTEWGPDGRVTDAVPRGVGLPDRDTGRSRRAPTPDASASGRRTWPRSSPRFTSWTTMLPPAWAAAGSPASRRPLRWATERAARPLTPLSGRRVACAHAATLAPGTAGGPTCQPTTRINRRQFLEKSSLLGRGGHGRRRRPEGERPDQQLGRDLHEAGAARVHRRRDPRHPPDGGGRRHLRGRDQGRRRLLQGAPRPRPGAHHAGPVGHRRLQGDPLPRRHRRGGDRDPRPLAPEDGPGSAGRGQARLRREADDPHRGRRARPSSRPRRRAARCSRWAAST